MTRYFSFVPVLLVATLHADVPSTLHHQGRIAVNNVNFTGNGDFKFLLFTDSDADHSSGNETAVWKNDDASPTDLTEPATAVSLTVTNGLYSNRLGEAPQATLPASLIPPVGEQLYLRTWFDNGINGSQQLTPDQQLASVPFALHADHASSADEASGVADMAITEAMLTDGAVTTAKLATGAVDNAILSPGAAGENIAAAGSFGIGLGGLAPRAPIDLNGNFDYHDPDLRAQIVDGIEGFNQLEAPQSIQVVGTTAYVASYDDDSLTVIDVSNPAAPSLLAEVVDNTGGFNQLNGASAVFVSGTTAYVTSYLDDSLTIIDVSNPAAPVLLAEVVDGLGGFNRLDGAASVFVSGSTAYVTSTFDKALTVIEVSNPATPVLLAEIVDGAGGFNHLERAVSVFVSGSTAYVTSDSEDSLTIIDVSNPASPSLLAEMVDGVGGFNLLEGASRVHVSGTTAYVTSVFDDSLTIVDVSNPAAPTLLAEITDGLGAFDRLAGAFGIHVSGTTAYVTAADDNSLTIIDVSDPANPALQAEVVDGLRGFNHLVAPVSVDVSGTTAFVASNNGDSITIIDAGEIASVDLLATNRIGIGTSRPAAMLHVEGDALVTGSLLDSTYAAGTSGQILSSSGTGTFWIDLLDNDPANELQTLGLASDSLSITGGNSVDLGPYFLGDGSEAFGGNLDLDGNNLTNVSLVETANLAVSGTVTAGINNTASGLLSATFGQNNNSTQSGTMTWGANNDATDVNATAFGSGNTATGARSAVWGISNETVGRDSTAWGAYNTAESYAETVFGRYDSNVAGASATGWNAADRLFVIGNGTNDVNRSDALVMLKSGDTTLNGELTLNGNLDVSGDSAFDGEVGIKTAPSSNAEVIIKSTGKKNLVLQSTGSQLDDSYWALYAEDENNGSGGLNRDLVLQWSDDGTTFSNRGAFDRITGAYSALSDRRHKKNIEPLEETLPKVRELDLHRFHFSQQDDSEPKNLGVIAQELQEAYPTLVNDSDTLTVNYAGLGVVALKAIQEQQDLIETQQESLAAQQALIESLARRLETLEQNL